MNHRKKTVSQKRQQEETNTPVNKRFKLSETVSADVKTNERSSNQTAQQPMKIYYTRLRRRMEEKLAKLNPQPIICTTKLTDVNADCLEHIFKHLSLIDLLNVADSNKQLKPAADLVFASQYGKRSMNIDVERKTVDLRGEDTDLLTAKILWSFRFKLLRCFGHLITELKIVHVRSHGPSQKDSKCAAEIDRYVNEYCADSLVEIEFENCNASTLDDLKKPFSKVETLYIIGCELGSKLSELDKWFPKVRRLGFLSANELLSGCNYIAVRFLELQHLSLYLPFDEKNSLSKKYFAGLLRLNPNLRSLYISGYFDAEYLQSVSKHLLHLECFEICPFGHFSSIGNDPVHFPNVKKLKLQNLPHGIGKDTFHFPNVEHLLLRNVALEHLPLTFDKLKVFEPESIAMDHTLANFIRKHKTIIKLNYSGYKRGKAGALLKIASPALVEVKFGHCAFPTDEVVPFMEECTSMKKLILGFANENDYQTVQKQLGKEWRGTEKGYCCMYEVTMER
ncbi:uncharacterized protein LOC129570651 [Sitodiplosis mosellana]|uniref:uncharacterized protein LOC129570651 n=1 Tax=Sitodiplosis mosellana TaxID=263140 RepID=UPI0024441DCF|nr:uncharacterized protein LOC129570651 [Sitodiplosis mosellana]